MNADKIANELTDIAKLVSNGKQASALNDEFIALRKEFGDKGAQEILDDLSLEADDLDTFDESRERGVAVYRLEAGREEWLGFKDDDDAVQYAEEYVLDMLDDEPELFNQDWIQAYVRMTDTDRRVYANDEADAYVGDMSDEEILEYNNTTDEYEEFQEKIEELESQWEEASEEYDNADLEEDEDAMDAANDRKDDIESELVKVKEQRDSFIDDARETAMSLYYEEVYKALDDPYEYFVEDRGIYSREEFLKSNLIYIEVHEAAADAVSTDGAGHFISGWDGNQVDSAKGSAWFRIN